MLSHKQIQKEILKKLKKEPRWNIIVGSNNWLCPFCGELGAHSLSMNDRKNRIEKKILGHFLEECTSWHFFDGEELEKEVLQKKASLLNLKEKIPENLQENPSWHFKECRGNWFCPFCLKSTSISLKKKGSQILNSPEDFFGHLKDCELFLGRKGQTYSLVEVQESVERYNKSFAFHSLKQKILSRPEWQALDNLSKWHCPYCLSQTEIKLARGKISKEAIQGIHVHLSNCSRYKNNPKSVESLQKIREVLVVSNQRNQYQKLYENITSDTLWQLLNTRNEWFCPFCADSSKIQVQNFNWESVLPEISNHLGECQNRKFSKNPRSFEEVKDKLKIHNKKLKIFQDLQTHIQDPLFRCTLKSGSWICPYCQEPQEQILLIGDPTIAFGEIADHLAASCYVYKPGSLPKITLHNLKKNFQKQPRNSPVRRNSLTRRMELDKSKILLYKEEQKKLVRSLEDARKKQRKMMPDFPNIEGIEFQALYKPCEHIGGDFYNIIELGDGNLGLAIGDVAGHGINAALLVGMVKKVMEVHGKTSLSPTEVLSRTHADIVEDLDGQTFITAFYAVLDYPNKLLRIANAGHNPMILYNEKREIPVQLLHVEGMALGLGSGNVFFQSLQEAELELISGDVIFLYTDGLLEAQNTKGEFFDEDKLLPILEKYGKYELEYLLYKVEKEITRFQGRGKQQDDITIFSFRIT